jgi:biotin transport system substrate-specific component
LQGVLGLRGYGARSFQWCEELPLKQKLALAIGFAVMIGIAAQVRVPVPWSPVPITGQTFAVLLAGILLGRNWGGFSVGIYAGAGALGLPWFQGLAGGLAYVAGPTGGYILGFVIAAAFVGYAVRKMPLARTLPGLLGLMLFANFVIIHGIGLLHLSNLTGITSPAELLWLGTIPFIPGDLTKVALAAAVAVVLLPRELNRKQ